MSVRARYVAIIADGNRRWADDRDLPIGASHRAAADTVKARLGDAIELGIDQLTICMHSTESLSPPKETMTGLLPRVAERIVSDTPALKEDGVRLRFIGHGKGIGVELAEHMAWAEAETAANEQITLFVALNYRSRVGIVDAALGDLTSSEEEFGAQLYATDMHDPDLLIRTGGEKRLSNNLLWQCAYSELIFRDESWPDFDRGVLEECLKEFETRQRRFGTRL